jgi:hypothetical protein
VSPIRWPRVKRQISFFAIRSTSCSLYTPAGLPGERPGSSSLQKPLLLDLIAPFDFPSPVRLLDTRPCLRFPGVVMDTRQSPIWIERWTAAPGAMPPCLGPCGPQKTFGTPTVSKSRGAPLAAASAVTVRWLAGACAWSSPFRAHGRGVSSIDQPRPGAGLCGGRCRDSPTVPHSPARWQCRIRSLRVSTLCVPGHAGASGAPGFPAPGLGEGSAPVVCLRLPARRIGQRGDATRAPRRGRTRKAVAAGPPPATAPALPDRPHAVNPGGPGAKPPGSPRGRPQPGGRSGDWRGLVCRASGSSADVLPWDPLRRRGSRCVVSQRVPDAAFPPGRGAARWMEERPISPAGFSPSPWTGSLLHPESVPPSYRKALSTSKGFWSRSMQ